MLDRERILAKVDEVDGYLRELRGVAPQSLTDYRRVEKKRACERLLQIAVEATIDVCSLLVAGLRLGLPGEEDDLFDKLEQAAVLSKGMSDTPRAMKGCRNALVHDYGRVDDEIIFEAVTAKLGDFDRFKQVVLRAIERGAG